MKTFKIQETGWELLICGFNTSNPIFVQSSTNEDAICFKLIYEQPSTETIVIPEGDWQLLGIHSELTNEQLEEVMPTMNDNGLIKRFDYVKGYYSHSLFSDLDSFHSLMKHMKCWTENPYGEKQPFVSVFDTWIESSANIARNKWQQAQQHVNDKYAVLIRKIN